MLERRRPAAGGGVAVQRARRGRRHRPQPFRAARPTGSGGGPQRWRAGPEPAVPVRLGPQVQALPRDADRRATVEAPTSSQQSQGDAPPLRPVDGESVRPTGRGPRHPHRRAARAGPLEAGGEGAGPATASVDDRDLGHAGAGRPRCSDVMRDGSRSGGRPASARACSARCWDGEEASPVERTQPNAAVAPAAPSQHRRPRRRASAPPAYRRGPGAVRAAGMRRPRVMPLPPRARCPPCSAAARVRRRSCSTAARPRTGARRPAAAPPARLLPAVPAGAVASRLGTGRARAARAASTSTATGCRRPPAPEPLPRTARWLVGPPRDARAPAAARSRLAAPGGDHG